MTSWFRQNGRKKFWLADCIARAIEWRLRDRLTLLKRDEVFRRFDGSSTRQLRIEEIEHLRAENRVMATDEDQHLPGCDDLLGCTVALLLRRFESQHLIGCHEGPLDVIDASVHVTHHWREPGPGEVVAGLL